MRTLPVYRNRDLQGVWSLPQQTHCRKAEIEVDVQDTIREAGVPATSFLISPAR